METEPLEGIIVSAAEETAQLVTIQSRPTLEVFTTPGLIPALLDRIRHEATTDFVPNVSTDKGRKEIASRAFRVARSKTYLDDIGKEEVARLKDLPRKMDAGRKELRDGMDQIRDEIRQPLTDWEAKQEGLKQRISLMKNLPPIGSNAEQIQVFIDNLRAIPMEREEWGALHREATLVNEETLLQLQDIHRERAQWEKDQVELEHLRKAEERRKQEEREEELRKEGEARALKLAKEAQQPTQPAAAPAAPAHRLAPLLEGDMAIPVPVPYLEQGQSLKRDQSLQDELIPPPVEKVPEFTGIITGLPILDDEPIPETVLASAPVQEPERPRTEFLNFMRKPDQESERTKTLQALEDLEAVFRKSMEPYRNPREAAQDVMRAILAGMIRHVSFKG